MKIKIKFIQYFSNIYNYFGFIYSRVFINNLTNLVANLYRLTIYLDENSI
ncbi:hypothetical protein ACINWCA157_2292 [Acinetobacter radioresistens WC-A-157]|jgi:hypothetical protein|nr:hypothetical protein ACINWCA157_2292 [Acinetobacter radioresistens WC-A-157]